MLEQTTEKLVTLDEFIAEYHKQPFELTNGQKRPIMPNVAIHGWLIRALVRLLDAYCIAHKLGEVFQELPFVETYSSLWVKGSKSPDILFFAADRWAKYMAEMENWQAKPFVLIPDFVVEVLSPNDSYSDLREKIDEYLTKGIRLIWIVEPLKKWVEVYAGQHYEKLTPTDILKGEDVFPGLEIQLSEVFK